MSLKPLKISYVLIAFAIICQVGFPQDNSKNISDEKQKQLDEIKRTATPKQLKQFFQGAAISKEISAIPEVQKKYEDARKEIIKNHSEGDGELLTNARDFRATAIGVALQVSQVMEDSESYEFVQLWTAYVGHRSKLFTHEADRMKGSRNLFVIPDTYKDSDRVHSATLLEYFVPRVSLFSLGQATPLKSDDRRELLKEFLRGEKNQEDALEDIKVIRKLVRDAIIEACKNPDGNQSDRLDRLFGLKP